MADMTPIIAEAIMRQKAARMPQPAPNEWSWLFNGGQFRPNTMNPPDPKEWSWLFAPAPLPNPREAR